MQKLQVHTGAKKTVLLLRAEVPTYKAPALSKKIETIDGEKYYVGADGKLYKAILYDAFFKVKKGKVLSRSMKGLGHAYAFR